MEGISQWTPIILMIFALYFLFILPQSRKAKKEKKFLSSLKNGDLVVTKSGMHGKIIEVNNSKKKCFFLSLACIILLFSTFLYFVLYSYLTKYK